MQIFHFTLLCCMCPSCVVRNTKLMCCICIVWSLPWDVCRGRSIVITCKHGSRWVMHGNCKLFSHGNCKLSWDGNYSCPEMTTAVVQSWQLQLSRDGNCSCLGMATAVVMGWQLQLSTTLLLLIHRLQFLFLQTNLCTTSMAGTWVPTAAMCCTKALHFFPT